MKTLPYSIQHSTEQRVLLCKYENVSNGYPDYETASQIGKAKGSFTVNVEQMANGRFYPIFISN